MYGAKKGKKGWVMLFLAFAAAFISAAAADAKSAVRLEDDYYDFANAEWLERAEIRPDRGSASIDKELDDKTRELLASDLKKLAAAETGDALLDAAAGFYEMAGDAGAREKLGWARAQADYRRIDALQGLDDLNAGLYRWIMDAMPLPFGLGVRAGYEDAANYALNAWMEDIFLDDPSYYEPENAAGERLRSLLRECLISLFRAAGLSAADAEAEAGRALAFDALMAAKALTSEERADIRSWLNPVSYADFIKKGKNAPLDALISRLILSRPGAVNLYDPRFFDSFGELYSAENFERMKSWMKARFLMDTSSFLGMRFLAPKLEYQAARVGADKTPPLGEVAFMQTRARFGDVIGKYYGEKYFGPEAKRDVTKMVESLIAVYGRRLENNPWLGGETKRAALRKLDAMQVRVGYPERDHPKYQYFRFIPAEKGGTLYENARNYNRAMTRYNFSLYGTPVDRTLWIADSLDVNAYYSSHDNSINIPAGILQAPFYSAGQSESANLGGIGAVIGHEISHAFDTNGGRFDESGNYRNWWTDADYKAFEKRAAAMTALFDGAPFAGGKVNGEMTKGENIADAGGLSCAAEVAKNGDRPDMDAFFRAYAASWQIKARPELLELLLTQDEHAPNKLRVNLQLSNMDVFYETYRVTEGDGMYLPPEKRVALW